MLKNKCVVLGVTGSIAAYKSASLASILVKNGCEVHVLLSKNGAQFITPLTFEALTGNKCIIDTFDRNFKFDISHISIAKKADLFIIAPASANIIAKTANGIADDMLSTTILACNCPKLISPAMNTNMYKNPIVQSNLERLRNFGFEIIEPASGRLACGVNDVGKMPEPSVLFEYITKHLAHNKDLKGKKVMITAGPTSESIDPVRCITNHSSGKMGYALARACVCRGAEVLLITGKTHIEKPLFADIIEVSSAESMFNAVKENYLSCDIIFKAAAVADYTPISKSSQKIKKSADNMTLELKRTEDILSFLGSHKKPEQIVCGFSMETDHLLENSRRKLENKCVDMIAANSLLQDGAGFQTDTNIITLITENDTVQLPLMTKFDAANVIIDHCLQLKN